MKKNNTKWTNFVRHWSSPDSCAGALGVAVEVTADEARELLRVWVEMSGKTGRPATTDDPDRPWWPDNPPQRVTKKFVELSVKLLSQSNGDIHSRLVERIATGGFMLAKDVPQSLREAFRALALSDDTEGIYEPIAGPPISNSCCLGKDWARFFRFLQRLGVTVREMPHRDSGRINSISVGFQHYALQMLFDGIETLEVNEEPAVL